jgi:hypothetical protein
LLKKKNVSLSAASCGPIQLGMFDPLNWPFTSTPMSVVGSDNHRALAFSAARKSIVLLEESGDRSLNKDLSASP